MDITFTCKWEENPPGMKQVFVSFWDAGFLRTHTEFYEWSVYENGSLVLQ